MDFCNVLENIIWHTPQLPILPSRLKIVYAHMVSCHFGGSFLHNPSLTTYHTHDIIHQARSAKALAELIMK